MIGTAIAMIVAGIAAGGGTVAAAKMSSNAAKHAGDLGASAADKALAFEREQETARKAEYDRDYARQIALEDAHLARRQGLRDAMGGERASLAGLRPTTPTGPPPAQGPRQAPPMPAGWKPGDPIGPLPPTTRPAPPQQRQWRTLRDLSPTAAPPPMTPPLAAGPMVDPRRGSLSALRTGAY